MSEDKKPNLHRFAHANAAPVDLDTLPLETREQLGHLERMLTKPVHTAEANFLFLQAITSVIYTMEQEEPDKNYSAWRVAIDKTIAYAVETGIYDAEVVRNRLMEGKEKPTLPPASQYVAA